MTFPTKQTTARVWQDTHGEAVLGFCAVVTIALKLKHYQFIPLLYSTQIQNYHYCDNPLMTTTGKGTTWEGGMRVPAAISYPTLIPPGTLDQPVGGGDKDEDEDGDVEDGDGDADGDGDGVCHALANM